MQQLGQCGEMTKLWLAGRVALGQIEPGECRPGDFDFRF
jgi:hypothetical protein